VARSTRRSLCPCRTFTTLGALGHEGRRREDFQSFYDQDPSYAPEYLRRWCYGATRSRLQPIKEFVTLVEKHWDGNIAWHTNHLSNGLPEGINSLIQAAETRARSYRSKAKMITIVYLTAAKLPLPSLPTQHPRTCPHAE
jgi:transposase